MLSNTTRPPAEPKPEPACLVRYAEDDPSHGEEEYDLSLKEFAAMKRRLAELRRPAAEPTDQPTASVIATVEGEITSETASFLQDARTADKMFLRDVLREFGSIALNRESEMCPAGRFPNSCTATPHDCAGRRTRQ